jgi:hypothetical protein
VYRIINIRIWLSIQFRKLKKLSNQVLDRTGAPPNLWLLCVLFIVYLINHLSSESLGLSTPAATVQQPDISAILAFLWYEPIHYKSYSSATFPSSSTVRHGRVVGIAEHKGDALTLSGGVNTAVGSSTHVETAWAGTTDSGTT